MGMESKIRYLLLASTLEYVHNLWSDAIDSCPDTRLVVMS